MATVSALVFLLINNHWLKGDKEEIENYLVKTAIEVARSDSKKRDNILIEVESWFNKHIVNTSDNQKTINIFGSGWRSR